MKKITLFFTLLITALTYGQVVINEVDADQEGTDNMEFIELLSETPNQSLDGLVVVLFNGSDDASYEAVDLDGFSTDANGFFIIGGDLVPDVDIALGETNIIQNGADAVVIFQGDLADFPNDTPVTTTNLIDAVVYGTNDADDTDLLMGLGETVQVNEDANDNNADFESIQRRDDGTYCTALTTLRAENICPDCALTFSFNSGTCDAVTGGQDTVTFLVDFTGGGSETVDLMLSDTGNIGGDDPSTMESGTIEITGVSEGTAITLSATGTTCDVSIDLFAVDCIPTAEVTTIAELRASAEGQSYTLTGEALLTFQQDFRNQKFIEDATAAILIDDPAGVITTAYTIGDGITGITGTLGSFNGLLQFVPETDPGDASSMNNMIVAQTVTITELNANPDDFESELVLIEAVLIDNSVSATWITGTEFPLEDQGSNIFVFRTSFFDVDYIDAPVPVVATDITGIITERNNGDYFITARDINDISAQANCPLDLGTITATCSTNTDATDEVIFTIPYTGGGTENYTIELIGGGVVQGDDPSTVAEGTIILAAISEGAMVDLEITSVSCTIILPLTAPDCEGATTVNSLAELRASTEGELYVLSSEAILTFQQDFRSQKFIEDDTAAILIDDPDDIITTIYAIGDGISGILGTLGSFEGQMQFVPEQDPGAASSTGNTIDPQAVTLTELTNNPDAYESELVEVSAVNVDNIINPTWIVGTAYLMSSSDGDFNFRTSFFDADYIGQDVPTDMLNIVGLITERDNGDYFFTARDSGDFELLSVEEDSTIDFSVFPNPATDQIQITTSDNQSKLVEIYSITGSLVLSKTVSTETMDISSLSNGLYLVRLTQNNATATIKLVKQ